jgi:predicted AAA+ superfamily ATPase
VRLICQSKPFEINIKELANKIGTSDYQTLYKYLEYLRRGKILNILRPKSKGDNIFSKPDKLYLSNTNLYFSYCSHSETGTIREVFFASQFDESALSSTKVGDFLIDEKYTIEVGGKNKSFKQIKDVENSFVVLDDVVIGSKHKIPLWLFGFLY